MYTLSENLLLIRTIESEMNVHPIGVFSIRDMNLEELSELSVKNKVPINPSRSEKDIVYYVDGFQRRSTVPLDTIIYGQLEIKLETRSCILRGDGFEAVITDHYRRMEETIEGRMKVSEGLNCKLSCQGDSRVKVQSLMQKVKKTITEYYQAFRDIKYEIIPSMDEETFKRIMDELAQ